MGFILDVLERKSLHGFVQGHDIIWYNRIIQDAVQGSSGGG